MLGESDLIFKSKGPTSTLDNLREEIHHNHTYLPNREQESRSQEVIFIFFTTKKSRLQSIPPNLTCYLKGICSIYIHISDIFFSSKMAQQNPHLAQFHPNSPSSRFIISSAYR